MTFGIIPGASLISYTYECGFEKKIFNLFGFLLFWREVKQAKKGAIKETGRMFFPWHPALGALLIGGVLIIIFSDSLILIVVNVSAIPTSLFAYRQGKRRSNPFWIVLFWLLFSTATMSMLYLLGYWKPN